jgi:hypothetical protein
MAELEDFGHPRHQQLFHVEFGAGMQIKVLQGLKVCPLQFRTESVDMGVHGGANLQGGGFNLGEAMPSKYWRIADKIRPRAARNGLFSAK